MVICLQQGADLHMAQLMPLPLTVSCFSKIQIGSTFLAGAHPGSPGQRAIKQLCVCFISNETVWSIYGTETSFIYLVKLSSILVLLAKLWKFEIIM